MLTAAVEDDGVALRQSFQLAVGDDVRERPLITSYAAHMHICRLRLHFVSQLVMGLRRLGLQVRYAFDTFMDILHSALLVA